MAPVLALHRRSLCGLLAGSSVFVMHIAWALGFFWGLIFVRGRPWPPGAAAPLWLDSRIGPLVMKRAVLPWDVGFREVARAGLNVTGNFCPSSPRTVKKHQGQRCPAERLNGNRYATNWLENLLVSGSMNGLRYYQQNPL
jgi:hypothetical protein